MSPPVTAVLNWSDQAHWSPLARPCSHCGLVTNLRDDEGEPAHKVCAEHHAAPAAPVPDQPTTAPTEHRGEPRAVACVMCGEPAVTATGAEGAYCATCSLF